MSALEVGPPELVTAARDAAARHQATSDMWAAALGTAPRHAPAPAAAGTGQGIRARVLVLAVSQLGDVDGLWAATSRAAAAGLCGRLQAADPDVDVRPCTLGDLIAAELLLTAGRLDRAALVQCVPVRTLRGRGRRLGLQVAALVLRQRAAELRGRQP